MAKASLDQAGGGIGSMLLDYSRRQLRRLAGALDGACESGKPKDVHALRVASRRLNEPLRLMDDAVGGRALRQSRRNLARLRRLFRHVRDLDVLGDTFREHEASGLIRPEQFSTLMPIVDSWRAGALRLAEKQARSKAFRTITAVFDQSVKRFEKRGSRSAQSITAALDRQFSNRVAEMRAGAIGTGADLHPLRIAAKKLRYCAELRHRLGVSDHAPLVAALTDAQSLLGHWNDQLTAASWLTTLAFNREMMASLSSICADMLEVASCVMRVAEADRDRIEIFWPRVLSAIDRPDVDTTIRLRPVARDAAVSRDTSGAVASPAATPGDN